MEISADILEEVSRRKLEQRTIERCLSVRVCPKCGSELDYDYFDDGGREYACTKCTFTYSI